MFKPSSTIIMFKSTIIMFKSSVQLVLDLKWGDSGDGDGREVCLGARCPSLGAAAVPVGSSGDFLGAGGGPVCTLGLAGSFLCGTWGGSWGFSARVRWLPD